MVDPIGPTFEIYQVSNVMGIGKRPSFDPEVVGYCGSAI